MASRAFSTFCLQSGVWLSQGHSSNASWESPGFSRLRSMSHSCLCPQTPATRRPCLSLSSEGRTPSFQGGRKAVLSSTETGDHLWCHGALRGLRCLEANCMSSLVHSDFSIWPGSAKSFTSHPSAFLLPKVWSCRLSCPSIFVRLCLLKKVLPMPSQRWNRRGKDTRVCPPAALFTYKGR